MLKLHLSISNPKCKTVKLPRDREVSKHFLWILLTILSLIQNSRPEPKLSLNCHFCWIVVVEKKARELPYLVIVSRFYIFYLTSQSEVLACALSEIIKKKYKFWGLDSAYYITLNSQYRPSAWYTEFKVI